MGRTLNSNNAAPVVPIGGAIYRNATTAGVVSYADGTQYIPSSGSAVLSATDYPIYVTTAVANSGSLPVGSTTYGFINNGTLTAVPINVTFNSGNPYMPYTQSNSRQNYPFSGQTSKNYFTGSTATNGSAVVATFCRAGYRNSTTVDIPAYVFNTSGTLLSSPTKKAIYTWYDSITSTFRIIGSDNSYDMKLFTSSDGVTWTMTNISYSSPSNNFLWQRMGTSNYFNVAQVHSGQKVFMTTNNDGGAGYALWCSTNNGATFTDRTENLVGAGTWYFAGSGAYQYINLNYDGTTLFMPYSGSWKYSTDDGVTWAASTISGVTSSPDNSAQGAIRGDNSSTFMYICSSAATSNRVYITTNGGQSFTSYSWTPSATLNGSYPEIAGAYDGSSRWCFAYVTNSGIVVATSTNNGSTWTHTLVSSATTLNAQFLMAYLDDAFYLGNSTFGILRSTNGTTWTNLTQSVSFPSYGQPYYSLTDAVVFGNWVIKKSNQQIYNLNSSTLISNQSGITSNFGNYISSDLFVKAQQALSTNHVYQLISSSDVFNTSTFSPSIYTSQQQTNQNQPNTIEYWRIK